MNGVAMGKGQQACEGSDRNPVVWRFKQACVGESASYSDKHLLAQS
jgi:hypothetical protein